MIVRGCKKDAGDGLTAAVAFWKIINRGNGDDGVVAEGKRISYQSWPIFGETWSQRWCTDSCSSHCMESRVKGAWLESRRHRRGDASQGWVPLTFASVCARGTATRNLLDQSYEGGWLYRRCLSPDTSGGILLFHWLFLLLTTSLEPVSTASRCEKEKKKLRGRRKSDTTGYQSPLASTGIIPDDFRALLMSPDNFSAGKINQPRGSDDERKWVSAFVWAEGILVFLDLIGGEDDCKTRMMVVFENWLRDCILVIGIGWVCSIKFMLYEK